MFQLDVAIVFIWPAGAVVAEFFYVLVMLVNGQVYPHVMGPYPDDDTCQVARVVNVPEKYTVLQVTPCFQLPKEI